MVDTWLKKLIRSKPFMVAPTIPDDYKSEELATFPALGQELLRAQQTMIPLASEPILKLALSLDTVFFGPRQSYFLLLLRFRKPAPALL
jgi:hypothetical protein